MDIREIESICAVDIYHNYSNAAYHIASSPAVISKHVSKIEKELGITNINGYYLGGTPDANGYIRDSKGNSLYHATLFEKGSKDGTPVTPPDIFD